MVFKQPLRQTEGLMRSIAKLLGVDITVPHFTIMSRRGNGLSLSAKAASMNANPLHLVVDSTGLKIFGEGEWLGKYIKPSANGALSASCTLALILSAARSFAPNWPQMTLVARPPYRHYWTRSTPPLIWSWRMVLTMVSRRLTFLPNASVRRLKSRSHL
jgi:hypothetical protein